MKRTLPHKLWILTLIGIVLILSGCASNLQNLEKTGTVSLEIVPSTSHNIVISEARVYQDGGELVIKGKVKRKTTIFESGGHVEIGIIGPEGKVLEEIWTGYVPSIIPRKGTRESSFSVHVPVILPAGSVVRVGYHS